MSWNVAGSGPLCCPFRKFGLPNIPISTSHSKIWGWQMGNLLYCCWQRKLDGGQVLEKPKKNQNHNKMDEKHENHYGMDGIGYRPLCPFLLPILEILAWPNSLRAPQIPKFEVDIWGNFYVVDQKAWRWASFRGTQEKQKQTQIFEENRENNENHYIMECGEYNKPLVPIFLPVWKIWLALIPHRHLTNHKEQSPVPNTFNNTTTNPSLQSTNRVAR